MEKIVTNIICKFLIGYFNNSTVVLVIGTRGVCTTWMCIKCLESDALQNEQFLSKHKNPKMTKAQTNGKR